MNKFEEALQKVKDKVVGCKKCELYQTRTYPVIGQGSHKAKIVLVGEAPGATEDKMARPFCGRAGQILTQLLDSIKLKREEIYICNILKCRPPGNRNPLPDEIISCTPYLKEQINAIRPKIIGTLGNYSSAFILKQYNLEDKIQGISKIHSQIFEAQADYGTIKIVPLYHPAVAVYNLNMMATLKKDFLSLIKALDEKEK